MENYAAYMAYTDYRGRPADRQPGRVRRARQHAGHVRRRRQRRERRGRAGGDLQRDRQPARRSARAGRASIKRIDEIGGPTSEPHVPGRLGLGDGRPVPVDQAGRQPLRRHAQPDGRPLAEGHQGEGRDSGPSSTTSSTSCRRSSRRARSPQPKVVNGIPQKPIEGRVDALLVRRRRTRRAGARRSTSSCATNRAIYHDGWVACSRYGCPGTPPAGATASSTLRGSCTTSTTTSARPTTSRRRTRRSSKELQARFLEEAKKYGVFPLDPRFSERLDPEAPRSPASRRRAGPTTATTSGCRSRSARSSSRGAHTITADLTIPKGGAEGVVACAGAFSAGWSLYVKDGKPVFRYTFFEIADVTIPGTVELPRGRSR